MAEYNPFSQFSRVYGVYIVRTYSMYVCCTCCCHVSTTFPDAFAMAPCGPRGHTWRKKAGLAPVRLRLRPFRFFLPSVVWCLSLPCFLGYSSFLISALLDHGSCLDKAVCFSAPTVLFHSDSYTTTGHTLRHLGLASGVSSAARKLFVLSFISALRFLPLRGMMCLRTDTKDEEPGCLISPRFRSS